MHVVIAGGSGFLGRALTRELVRTNHQVTVLTRRQSGPANGNPALVQWNPDGKSGPWARVIDGVDAVVNLAGESIGDRRWSAEHKRKVLDSRLAATRSLTAAISNASRPPRVFLSGSAVGYYGDRGNETLTEASPPGHDFLAGVVQQWETAAQEAAQVTRVALIRTGIVLDRVEGALPRMLPPFRFFVGGPLGSGTQYMPWIHLEDWVRLAAWILEHEGARGPLNGTAPRPVTNAEFSKALGRVLKRPSLLPAPAFALRLILGEMADALLLSSQRVLPVRATDLGFSFRYSSIDEALANVLS